MRRSSRSVAIAGLALLTGCPWPGSGPGCEPLADPVALPEALDESSGIAVSRRYPGVFWTHNDGSDPVLHAVDATGSLVSRVRLAGVRLTDWEDLELAPCGDVDCLYLADTGDNEERRDTLRLLRLREPDPSADTVASDVDVFPLLLPDGPRDVEALFVLPGERVHLVSKGANHPVSVYRSRTPLTAGAAIEMEEVQRLGTDPRALPRQVTGASATPDGERVLIRTYELLTFHRVDGDTLVAEGEPLNLRPLREAQGEGVGAGPDGLIALSSEAGPLGRLSSMALVRCRM